MIINQRESISWGEVQGTFMYGSEIIYHKDKHIVYLIPWCHQEKS